MPCSLYNEHTIKSEQATTECGEGWDYETECRNGPTVFGRTEVSVPRKGPYLKFQVQMNLMISWICSRAVEIRSGSNVGCETQFGPQPETQTRNILTDHLTQSKEGISTLSDKNE